jgi:hypothetical protein
MPDLRSALPKGTVDETGHIYGCLKVREYAGLDRGGGSAWLCDCGCGDADCRRHIIARGAKLRSGRIVSCGRQRANSGVRRAASLKTPAARRKAIAAMGAAARLQAIGGRDG